MIPTIVEGYNAAFLVAGSSSSGRNFTFYGEDTDGEQRGIFPRFTEEILDAFEKKKEENSTISCELEAIDISGETYVDLLASRKSKSSQPKEEEQQQLKLQTGADGARLTGCTSVEVNSAKDFRTTVKQLARVVKRRNCTHTVSLRFTESFEFEDPENKGQSITKSRRVRVVFIILRNLPPSFQRVIDVAAEHDSGENPMAKVPIREAAISKLYPEVFQQGYNLTFISCLSPYYEHVRDNLNTLTFNTKAKKLRGKPKLVQDESLVEMRKLADEVKDLKVAARKQNQAMQLVQQELNAREVELMKQEANYNEVCNNIKKTQEETFLTTVSRNMEVDKNKKEKKALYLEMNQDKKKREKYEKLLREIDDAKFRTEENERKANAEKDKQEALQQSVQAAEKEEKEVQDIENFNVAGKEDQKKEIIASSPLHKADEKEINELKKKVKEIQNNDESVPQMKEIQAEYDKAYAAEAPSREKKDLEKEIEKLEKEIKDVEAETKKLQDEIDAQKCCSVM
ncbi:kinesin family member 3/17 [Angomonas deanei]|uniref:Kinesin motor domain/Microtubule binding, putative n=1 Tax=Angomonas deanei TaxID=59799 RepID=A0A7G2C056_9TRYP|nr:kinesin family member 3/17 [Angomonas deanei]CAD2213100.1 Kinesin motor domain/Microtubule binding, putative [Angomonas deanei]|eukprot:EPY38809.1 kinesin family member 3/17 [Angomonas deanei]